MEIEREVLVKKTRLLGAEHEETLISASNLADSLSRCGQNAEGTQRYCEALALSRRALGPAHGLAHQILANMRALGFAAR